MKCEVGDHVLILFYWWPLPKTARAWSSLRVQSTRAFIFSIFFSMMMMSNCLIATTGDRRKKGIWYLLKAPWADLQLNKWLAECELWRVIIIHGTKSRGMYAHNHHPPTRLINFDMYIIMIWHFFNLIYFGSIIHKKSMCQESRRTPIYTKQKATVQTILPALVCIFLIS